MLPLTDFLLAIRFLCILLLSEHFLQLPYRVHELARAHGRHDVPPAVQLQEPGPGETDALPEQAELGAELEVDVPEDVREHEQGERDAAAGLPGVDLVLGEGGLAPVEEVGHADDDEDHHKEEGGRVVDDLAGPDVEGGEEGEDEVQRRVNEAVVGGRASAHRQDALQQRPGQAQHAQLVGVLERVPQRGVEQEGADAQDEQGDRHEVSARPENSPATRAIHVFQGEVD